MYQRKSAGLGQLQARVIARQRYHRLMEIDDTSVTESQAVTATSIAAPELNRGNGHPPPTNYFLYSLENKNAVEQSGRQKYRTCLFDARGAVAWFTHDHSCVNSNPQLFNPPLDLPVCFGTL
jgi:hypothetical protein